MKKNERQNGRLTFGFTNSLNFLGENILKFERCVDTIWKAKDGSTYYLSRDNIEKFVVQILRKLHDTSDECKVKNNESLKKMWQDLLDKEMQAYYVSFPIYGVVVPSRTDISEFSAYNANDYKNFISKINETSKNVLEELHYVKNDLNYLVLESKAKDPQRAVELARQHFELFEHVAKFLLYGNQNFDIGIFNYNGRYIVEGHAFKKSSSLSNSKDFFSFSKAQGTYQQVNVKDLNSDECKFFWEILSRYINGSTSDIENKLMNAIRWIGIANSNDSNITRYVQYVFALESLLAYRPEKKIITPSIAYQLAEYSAFIVGENANEEVISKKELRRQTFQAVKNLYSNRSKIVHGNDNTTIDKKLLGDAREIIYAVIHSFIRIQEKYQFKDLQKLSCWIEDLKFSE